jgi:hypothetical protein
MGILPGQGYMGYPGGYLEGTCADDTRAFNGVFFVGGGGKDQILEDIVVCAPTREELQACREHMCQVRLKAGFAISLLRQ